MPRLVAAADHPSARRYASRLRRRAEWSPLFPVRPDRRRVGGPAPRSRRLPYYPGLPVPVIRLRGARYGCARRAGHVVVRGWTVGTQEVALITFIAYLALRRHEESPVGDLARDVAGADELSRDAVAARIGLCFPRPLVEPLDVCDLVRQLEPHGADVAEAAAAAWLDYGRYLRSRRREAA